MAYEKVYEKAYYEIKNERFDEVLRGVIDIHIHAGPDVIPRRMDIFEIAREARDRGMKAVVCKPFAYCNAPLAKAAEQLTPGIRVFGGLMLDLAVGGYNPRAVEAAIKLGSKFIWGPVFDSAITVKKSPKVRWYQELGTIKEKAGLRPVDEKGRIKEEVKDIFALIAEADDVIFATGHQFPEDTMKLIEAAKKAGIKKFVVTHPHAPVIGATIEEQREMVRLGAKLDYVWCNATPYYDRTDPAEYAEAMKAIGVRHIIMSTDFGQPVNPTPAEGMANYILTMMTKGITKAEIDIMCRKNPGELLGI
jgi:hypothetical protein